MGSFLTRSILEQFKFYLNVLFCCDLLVLQIHELICKSLFLGLISFVNNTIRIIDEIYYFLTTTKNALLRIVDRLAVSNLSLIHI